MISDRYGMRLRGANKRVGAAWEYLLFCYVFVSAVLAVAYPPVGARSWWIRLHGFGDIRQPCRIRDCLIEAARRDQTLGPLRIESRGGQLKVVGMGLCRSVRSRAEGQELIARLKGDIGRVFAPVPRPVSSVTPEATT